MKRKEIAALLAITISSVGLLSACGVYGPPEDYDDTQIENSEYLNGQTIETESEDVFEADIDDFDPSAQEEVDVYGPAPNY